MDAKVLLFFLRHLFCPASVDSLLKRFGHGAFLVCLEELYKKITGRDMIYTALIGKPSELTMHHADNMAQLHARALGVHGIVKRIYFVGYAVSC